MQGGKNFRGHSPWILPQEKSPGRSNANLLGSSGSRGASAGVRLPHLTGPPRRNPAAGSRQSRPPPPLEVRSGPVRAPRPRRGSPSHPRPAPSSAEQTHAAGGRGKRGARAREGSLPAAATHLVAEHSWGGGKGAGRGMGGREGKKRRLPGLLRARGSSTGSRPLAAAVRRSVRGDVRRRASGWAGAPAAAAAPGQIWRWASQCERREGGPEERHCARAGDRRRFGEPEPAAPPPCSQRQPDAVLTVTRLPSVTGRRKAL